jgi:outer membrane protein OmpA-like peptidoglycan-associated protein
VFLAALLYVSFHTDRTIEKTRQVQIDEKLRSLGESVRTSEAASDKIGAELMRAQVELSERNAELQKLLARSVEDQKKAAAAVQEVQSALEKALRTVATLECQSDDCKINFQDTFLFEPSHAELDCTKKENLAKLVGFLTFKLRTGSWKIRITGHTDNTGPSGDLEKYNLDLSKHRAESVRDYLVKAGLPADIITTVAAGYSQPLGFDSPQGDEVVKLHNSNPDQRAKNRRVQIKLEAK